MKTFDEIESECVPIFHDPFRLSDEEYLWASDHIGVTCTFALVR